MTTPRVTVITPTYNRSGLLAATVRSVLRQTFSDFEYLLVDDGSTDDTFQAAAALAAEDGRIVLHRRVNGGGARARAFGLSEARGEYVAFLDHDDQWDPNKLSLQVRRLDDHREEGVVFGRVRLVDQAGMPKGPLRVRYHQGWVQRPLLVCQNFLGTYSNPMIRTTLLREIGGPDIEVGMSDDWDLFLRLAEKTRFGFIDRDLVLYNVGNEASQSRDMLAAMEAERRVLRKHHAAIERLDGLSRFRLNYNMRRRRAEMLRLTGWRAQSEGALSEAAGSYRAALRLNPLVFLKLHVIRDLASLARRSARSPQ